MDEELYHVNYYDLHGIVTAIEFSVAKDDSLSRARFIAMYRAPKDIVKIELMRNFQVVAFRTANYRIDWCPWEE